MADITGRPINWPALAGKTVLITGANGFLSAYMVETLLFLNEMNDGQATKVIGLDLAADRFRHYLGRDDFEMITQDVCAPLPQNLKVDFIVHAASLASPKHYGTNPVGVLSANVMGTHNLLEFAHQQQVESFLYFSSGEIYGAIDPSRMPLKESSFGRVDPANVRSCYAESKRMGETMCVSWHHQHGVPAKIVRPFHTYGPGMRLDDGRVFADFVADILANRDIVMQSDGSAKRAFTYLADAVAAFFQVLLSGQCAYPYNVANASCEVSILELATMLTDLFPEKGLKVVAKELSPTTGSLKNEISRAYPDTSRVCALGWAPKHGVKEGFTRTIRSFQ